MRRKMRRRRKRKLRPPSDDATSTMPANAKIGRCIEQIANPIEWWWSIDQIENIIIVMEIQHVVNVNPSVRLLVLRFDWGTYRFAWLSQLAFVIIRLSGVHRLVETLKLNIKFHFLYSHHSTSGKNMNSNLDKNLRKLTLVPKLQLRPPQWREYRNFFWYWYGQESQNKKLVGCLAVEYFKIGVGLPRSSTNDGIIQRIQNGTVMEKTSTGHAI